MITVTCSFDTPLGRFSEEDYLRTVKLTVWTFGPNDEQLVLGELLADQLLLSEAKMEGKSVLGICDADSQGLFEVYQALFSEGGEFQEELSIGEPTGHILFIWNSVLHPKIRAYEAAILEVAATLFNYDCVLAIWRRCSSLSDKELSECGFSKISGTELLFRHVSLLTDYNKANPRGIEVPYDFEADEADAAWVRAHLKRLSQ